MIPYMWKVFNKYLLSERKDKKITGPSERNVGPPLVGDKTCSQIIMMQTGKESQIVHPESSR